MSTKGNMNRKLGPLAALAMVALIGAGCSNSADENGDAGNANANYESAVKFSECMRDNGVEDFPDPVEGEPLVDTRKIPSAATSSGHSAVNAAMQACRDGAAAAGVTGQ